MRAASEGLALESEGEDAGLVQGGEARLGLTVLLNTRNVGPEPAVHLRPGYVLVTVPLRVSEVKNVLQKTISLLQIRNAHVTGRWALIVKNFIYCERTHSLGGTHPPLGFPSRPLTKASLVHLQWISSGTCSPGIVLPTSQTGAGF